MTASLLLLVSSLQAETFVGEGATGLSTLKIPTSARAAAMSGSFASIAGDVSAMEYNPAGLSNLTRTDVLLSHMVYVEDSSLQSISLGFPVSLQDGPSVREVEDNLFLRNRVNVGFQYRVFRSQDTERNNVGVKGSSFDIRDQVIEGALAYPLSFRTSVGLGVKYLSSTLQSESANMYALDTGVQYKLNDHVSLGAAVQNMGSSKAYIDVKDPLPTTGRLGGSWQAEKLLVSADASMGRDEIIRESVGAEYALGSILKVRGGVFNDTNLEFSGGIGVRFQGPQKAPVVSAPRKRVDVDEPFRKTLDSVEGKKESLDASGSESGKNIFSNVDIGLDYGLATRHDFGIVHTVSIRVLY